MEVDVPAPGPNEVVVRVDATPISPSDLALLLGPADLASARNVGKALVATVPPQRLIAVQARLDQSMPVGNEGAGVVVDAGSEARGLIGKTVAMVAGGMYAQYRVVPANACMVLPDGVTTRR